MTTKDATVTRQSRPVRIVAETVVLILIAIVLAIVVKTFFVQAFFIPSGSMEPGLKVHDRILVEKPSYWFGHPQRGDIVVFSDPGGWLNAEEDAGPTGAVPTLMEKIGLYPSGGHLVKRVIGTPGDTVSCCNKHGEIEVNGHPLDESSYIAPQSVCNGPMAGCKGWHVKVPPGDLFVMGDNRAESADSSYHLCIGGRSAAGTACDLAFVPEKDVVGRVVAVIWPADHIKWLHRPADFKGIPAPSR